MHVVKYTRINGSVANPRAERLNPELANSRFKLYFAIKYDCAGVSVIVGCIPEPVREICESTSVGVIGPVINTMRLIRFRCSVRHWVSSTRRRKLGVAPENYCGLAFRREAGGFDP